MPLFVPNWERTGKIQTLINILKDGDPSMQAKAADTLTTMGQVAAEALRELTNHPHHRVRFLLAWALSEIEK